MYTLKKQIKYKFIPEANIYEVDLGGEIIKLTSEKFHKIFALKRPDLSKIEITKLAQSVIDSQALLDDDNSEYLFLEAVDAAHKIIKLS